MGDSLPPTPARVATLGYYGFGNLGDEAVLAGIRRTLDEVLPMDLLVLTADAAETARLHPGVRTAARWDWRAAGALKGTDLFVLGGGSLLQDATSVNSVVWYALMALIARRKARRVLWWAQGIGPLNSGISRRLVRLIANQADAITVRDDASAALLKEIGVRGSIETVADPAFALTPDTQSGAELDSPPIRPTPHTLIALRRWKDDAAIGTAFAGAFGKEKFGKEKFGKEAFGQGTNGAGLPMHLPGDAEYMSEIFGNTFPQINWRQSGMTTEQAVGVVAGAKLVIAMRLHALIFAARCAVPFVAVSYDRKVDALAHAAGQEDALIPVNELTGERLSETIKRVQETASVRRVALTAFAAVQGERARIPARIAAGMV